MATATSLLSDSTGSVASTTLPISTSSTVEHGSKQEFANSSTSSPTAAIYVVLHYLSHPVEATRDTLLFEQVEIAVRAKVDGIFVISHSGLDASLPPLARRIKQKHPTLHVGINLLSRSFIDAAKIAIDHQLDMVWGDRCGISSKGIDEEGRELVEWLNEYRAAKAKSLVNSDASTSESASSIEPLPSASSLKPSLPLMVFGSVAFKGQRPIETEEGASIAAQLALKSDFIPTTSGPMTGIPPKLSKIRAMSKATSGCLAIASGISTRNVCQFAPLLSHILVSTGVSKNEWELDPVKLSMLVKLVRTHATQRPPDYPGEVISEGEDL